MGHEVTVSVGEPWDFESTDGQGRLEGRIVAVSDTEQERRDQWVRIEVTHFEAEDGSTITNLTATRRHVGETGIIEQIARGESADVNLSYQHQVDEERMPQGVSPFLIGGLQLRES